MLMCEISLHHQSARFLLPNGKVRSLLDIYLN